MRVFIGVDLDAQLKRRIELAEHRRPHSNRVRWEGLEKLHLTLRFLGEVPDERLAEINGRVSRTVAETRPFEIVIGGAGVFPNLRKPNVLWLDVQDPAGELTVLAGRLNTAMTELGFAPERVPFRPHLTVARLQPGAWVRPILAELQADPGLRTTQTVNSVVVFKSELRPGGSLYTRLAEHPLTGPSNQGELS